MGSRSESICRQSQVEVRPLDQLWKWRFLQLTQHATHDFLVNIPLIA